MAQRKLPYAMIYVAENDIEPKYQKFLREWARNLNISVNALLKRILLAAVGGEVYVESMPEKGS